MAQRIKAFILGIKEYREDWTYSVLYSNRDWFMQEDAAYQLGQRIRRFFSSYQKCPVYFNVLRPGEWQPSRTKVCTEKLDTDLSLSAHEIAVACEKAANAIQNHQKF